MEYPSKIKLMHILGGLPVGGAEVLLLTLIKKLSTERYDIYICSISDSGIIGSEIKEVGVSLILLRRSLRVYNLITIWSLFKLIRKIKPTIVQTHIYPSNTLGRIAAFLANVPVLIATEHGLYKTKKRRQIFIDRLLSYVTDKIIVVSNAVKIYAHTQSKIPSNRFEVIYNFVDPEQFVPRRSRKDMRCELGLEANDIVVGSTGRLVKEKGYDFLLKAIKLLLEGGKDLKLVLVGDGPYLEVLKKKAQLYHIQNNIIFLGNRRDVPDLLNIMDVFVMPTLEEGFGLSIIEAQLFNLPVIASEVDGIPEIIEDGISGLLVPPKNYEALSKAINLLLKNESLSKKLGKAGHEIVLEKFVANVQANHLSSLYESLMREKLDSKRKWSWKI